MLNVNVGAFAPGDGDIDMIFEGQCEDSWFEDDYVKQLVKEIDNSEVQSIHSIISPVLGMISYSRLSGGVKTLIMLYMMPEIEQWGSAMGDNCMQQLFNIASKKDITVKFSHIPEIPENAVANFLPDNKVCYGSDEIRKEILERL